MRQSAVCSVMATVAWLGLAMVACAPSSAAPAAPASTHKAVGSEVPNPHSLFSGDYKDANLRDVLMDVAKAAGMNVVVPADLDGTITAHFDKLPVMKALAYVANTANADYRVMDDTVTIVKRSIVVRPSARSTAASTATSTRTTRTAESEVESAASRIDAEDEALYRRPSAVSQAAQPPVVVQTYVNIQNPTPQPSYAPMYPGYVAGYPGYGYLAYGGYPVGAPYPALGGYSFRINNGWTATVLPTAPIYVGTGRYHVRDGDCDTSDDTARTRHRRR